MSRDNVYLVIAAVGHTQTFVLGQFRLQQFFAYRCNDFFHIQFKLYTMSLTYCAHCRGVFDLSKVCQGMGFPMVMVNVL